MTVGTLKRIMPLSEFVTWMAYLEEEVNDFNPLYYYLAQIAAEVRRNISKDPTKPKLKDFLIKFGAEKKDTKSKTEDARQFFSMLTSTTNKRANKKRKKT